MSKLHLCKPSHRLLWAAIFLYVFSCQIQNLLSFFYDILHSHHSSGLIPGESGMQRVLLGWPRIKAASRFIVVNSGPVKIVCMIWCFFSTFAHVFISNLSKSGDWVEYWSFKYIIGEICENITQNLPLSETKDIRLRVFPGYSSFKNQ